MDDDPRFWKAVSKTPGCWLWTGYLDKDGYGWLTRSKGLPKIMNVRAHRYSWMLLRGAIPGGLCVLHKCDVRSCVNPDHLFLGSNLQNTDDMISKGRSPILFRPGAENSNASLTWDDAKAIRSIYGTGPAGPTQKEIASMFGVSQAVISRIIRRETYV